MLVIGFSVGRCRCDMSFSSRIAQNIDQSRKQEQGCVSGNQW
ncbi:hypothetical protein DyAD56_13680 [Dyella sp. AD56]|nr:hypothetical protein DyAD56_13680 [Dyella sp. AD56]